MGGVQQVFFKLGGAFGHLLRELLEFVTFCLIQLYTGEAKITNGIINDLFLGNIQLLIFRPFCNGFVGLIKRFILAQLRRKFAEFWQTGIVGLTQFFGIHY